MQRFRLLGSKDNEATLALARAWRSLGEDAEVVSAAEALSSVRPDDVVVARLDILPTLDGVEPGLLAVLLLERRGTCVVNTAGALLAAHDKLRTARLLAAACLPAPATEHVTAGGPRTIRPPLVVKPRFGSWGRDVFLCEDDAAVDACLRSVRERPWFRRHGAIAQALVPPLGHDLRIVVANGRAIGAAERFAAPGEWRTNVSLGGSIRTADPGDDAVQLARAAAAVIGADLVGVDLAPLAGGGYVVLELNGAVEFDETYAAAGRSVYEDALRALGAAAVAHAR